MKRRIAEAVMTSLLCTVAVGIAEIGLDAVREYRQTCRKRRKKAKK